MRLRDKNGNFVLGARVAVSSVLGLIIIFTTLSSAVFAMSKQVSIADGNRTLRVTTFAKEIAEVLAEENIVLGEGDEVNFQLDEAVPHGAEIIISRAVPVKVLEGNTEYQKYTAKSTVGEALEAMGMGLSETDVVSPSADTAITPHMTISVTRLSEETIEIEEVIPFTIRKKTNASLGDGKTKVIQEGKEGRQKSIYKVLRKNGEELSRELVETVVIEKAVDKIVEYGVPKQSTTASVRYQTGTLTSRGESVRYKAVLEVRASAYDACYKCTGKTPGTRGYGITATGRKAGYGVVAVDPRIIPLGSRLYIESLDGSWTYGYAVAADTGGSIKQNRIDLCMDSHSEALKFGMRNARVYVLE